MDQGYPDGLDVPAWAAEGCWRSAPSALVTLCSGNRGGSAGAALPDLADESACLIAEKLTRMNGEPCWSRPRRALLRRRQSYRLQCARGEAVVGFHCQVRE